MDSLCNYYQLLGITTNANAEEIQKAYRSKAKEYHPDLNGGTEKSKEMFQRLGKAKECLTDPAKRLEHDYFIGVKRRPQQRTYSDPGNDPSQQHRPSQSSSSDAIWGVGLAAMAIVAIVAWFFGDEEDDSNIG